MNIELTKKTKLLTAGKVCHEDIVILPVLQSKTVTENGVVVPDSGYVGLNHVVVNIPEKEDSVLGNIDKPILPKFGRLKCFANERQMVVYKDVYPCNRGSGLGVTTDGNALAGVGVDTAFSFVYDLYTDLPGTDYGICDAGSGRYIGYPYTSLVATWCQLAASAAFIPDIYVPPCTCKIALCNPYTAQIVNNEYDITEHTLTSRFASDASGLMCLVYNHFSLGCNFDGLYILAAEFEYPKANVTLSPESTDWEYSVNDGLTYSSVAEEITLDQVEHFILRNTSAGTKFIANSSSNFISVNAGAAYAVHVTEDTKWVLE